jgi:hypothetical protein
MRLRIVQIYEVNLQRKCDLKVSLRDCDIHGRINRKVICGDN